MKIIQTGDLHHGFSQKTHSQIEKMMHDISKEEHDLLILVGDSISHDQKSWKKFFKLVRTFEDKPVLAVCGNHDWWVRNRYKRYGDVPKLDIIEKVEKYHKKIFDSFDITYLHDKPFINDEIEVYGFDGWYSHSNPPTNDEANIPESKDGQPIHLYMNIRSYRKLDKIIHELEPTNKKRIMVTHFPVYRTEHEDALFSGHESYLNFIEERFDILLNGHSHLQSISEYKSLKIFNNGSDYDQPKFLIINTGEL